METARGPAPATRTAPYFTDASVLHPAYGGPPTVILGPGEMKRAHQTDEYCHASRLTEAVALYERLIDDWIDGPRYRRASLVGSRDTDREPSLVEAALVPGRDTQCPQML